MGRISWPFFIRKLPYRDSIVLFGYTLKVEKLNSCVCTCMFGFCEDFHELSLWHLQYLYYWKLCMVLDFSKSWNGMKEKQILFIWKHVALNGTDVKSQDLNVFEAADSFPILNWTSGGSKHSGSCVCESILVFSSYEDTRLIVSSKNNLSRCWNLSEFWKQNPIVSTMMSKHGPWITCIRVTPRAYWNIDSLDSPYTLPKNPCGQRLYVCLWYLTSLSRSHW